MRSKSWLFVCLLGVLMILAAGLLCVRNFRESEDAAAYSDQVLDALKQEIPDEPAVTEPKQTGEDLFAPYETEPDSSDEAEDIVVGEDAYCGFISMPSLNLELPVMSSLSYPNLKKSPCRYSGSAQTNDLIIAAHNYTSHFGKIRRLTAEDPIIFTDTRGRQFRYAVSFIEVIEGQDVDQMFSGQAEEWDLTLFTCTLGGKSRVTIRADRITDETEA
ncbi:MAG: sortase [Oscillospiraceae bacterium]|nr:sortase [Oscillospiraceae bacterium]